MTKLILPDTVYSMPQLRCKTITVPYDGIANANATAISAFVNAFYQDPLNKYFGLIGVPTIIFSTADTVEFYITFHYIDYTPIEPPKTRLNNPTMLSNQPIFSSFNQSS